MWYLCLIAGFACDLEVGSAPLPRMQMGPRKQTLLDPDFGSWPGSRGTPVARNSTPNRHRQPCPDQKNAAQTGTRTANLADETKLFSRVRKARPCPEFTAKRIVAEAIHLLDHATLTRVHTALIAMRRNKNRSPKNEWMASSCCIQYTSVVRSAECQSQPENFLKGSSSRRMARTPPYVDRASASFTILSIMSV